MPSGSDVMLSIVLKTFSKECALRDNQLAASREKNASEWLYSTEHDKSLQVFYGLCCLTQQNVEFEG